MSIMHTAAARVKFNRTITYVYLASETPGHQPGASIPIYPWRQMRHGQFFFGGGFIKSLTNFSIQKSI